ncbi:MAG: PEP-CTERM sorting domain-containing protein, partial [Planctomycetota bacterium]
QDYPYAGPWEVGVDNGTEEQNGTYDMMGNVMEWNETLVWSSRGVRGGWYGMDYYNFGSYRRGTVIPGSETGHIGFRVVAIPEPATLLLFGLGGLSLVGRGKRR